MEISDETFSRETEKQIPAYIAIDLKSYYASCECADRKLDPLTTHLVVADLSRTEKTICLAVSPSLKALGVPGRPRLFEVIRKVGEINARRLRAYRQATGNPYAEFTGKSFDAETLASDPSLAVDYLAATPRMARYMEVSAKIYSIYLRYISKEDIIVYSVDEVFIDASRYLEMYGMNARELAMTMIRQVLYETGITAAAGIGTNLYLAKIAMDIVAKHVDADENGVRIAELDEISYRKLLWNHKPLTDFWRIGPCTARKLEANGMYTLGDVARMSVTKTPVAVHLTRPRKNEPSLRRMANGEDLLYRLFGVSAELLIDHAWGYEPTTVAAVKKYRPKTSSLCSGQVLHEPYTYAKARIIVREMADELSLSLFRKGLAAGKIELTIGFDRESLVKTDERWRYPDGRLYEGAVVPDAYGRAHPKHVGGIKALPFPTASTKLIVETALRIFEEKTDAGLLVRRINITASEIMPEGEAERLRTESANLPEQLDPFTDYEKKDAEREKERKQEERESRLQKTLLSIKDRYGKDAVLKGTNFMEGAPGKEQGSRRP